MLEYACFASTHALYVVEVNVNNGSSAVSSSVEEVCFCA